MGISKVRKRDGRVVDFERDKIIQAIFKAAQAVGGEDMELAKKLADDVMASLEENFKKEIPSVEDVQDAVEKVLIENGHAKTAKAYILYRQERENIRGAKELLGVRDELKLPVNTIKVLKSRYLLKDEDGNVIESTGELFTRVARHVALADILHHDLVFDREREQTVKDVKPLDAMPEKAKELGLSMSDVQMLYRGYKRMNLKKQMKATFSELVEILKKKWPEIKKAQDEFYDSLTNFYFTPNSPTLMNAGAPLGQLSGCFVLPVGDSLESIFDSLKHTALIHQSGGGTGFSFSKLRFKGDMVKSTKGVASGPLSFMRVFDVATDVIKQGGKRRGANMGMLSIHHPDVLDFITSKDSENRLFSNFNISVAVTDRFMKALEDDKEYELTNPRNGQPVKKLFARQVWEMITYQAWKTGDPGIIFIDEINRHNPTPQIGEIEATNPCVTGDSLIPTDHGFIRMEELSKGHHTSLVVDTRTVGLEGTATSPLLRAWKTGVKDTFRLVTKSGYEITATPDHKIRTPDGWAKLGDLKPGKDKVLIQGGSGKWSSDKKLPFMVKNATMGKNGREYRMNLPSEWSPELGQILGYLIGDGWLRDGDKDRRVGFTFSKDDENILECLKPVLNGMYGSEIKEVERENGVTHLSYHGKEFVGFFRKLGVMPVCAEKKVVPESIFTATEEAVIGFLQGLFTADGTANFVKGKSSYVRLTSKSEKLLKQVQILLLNFGIKSRIYDRSRPARKIFPYRKKDGTEKLYDSDGVCYELEISRDSLPKFTDRIGFMCGKHAGKMAKLAGKGYYRNVFEDAIAEIMPNGKEVVYDLTEPFTHSFICNGIIVSNCGEQPLLPYESCNLGSINLAKMIKEAGKGFEVDWERLKTTTELAVHFLDNVIDANRFPIQQIEFMTMANRKIGLGVMGFADMLIEMGISYASDEALKLGEKIMKFITETAREYSVELGKTRGSFPNFKGSLWEKKGYKTMRNAALTTIAPTGTISIIAGVSSGIEPLFAVVFVRKNVLGGETELLEANPMFEKYAHDHEFYSEALMKEVSDTGSIHHAEGVPKEAKELFLTAHDIDPDSHIKMQAAFQKYTDNAVSKTINLRMEAGISDVEKAYLTAWKLKCKGITIYRDASKTIQVIHIGKGRKEEKEQMIIHNGEGETLKESDESCPACKSKLYSAEGCFTCLGCGYSKCG